MRSVLAWRMLMREWRGGEVGLLLASLVLGVTLVTGISLFAERLQKALVGEASVYLGADRVLQVSDPAPANWLDKAGQHGIRVAHTVLFPTMVYPSRTDSDRSVLGALKAVSATYPLRGDLEVRDQNNQLTIVDHGPTKGMAWVDSNILAQLDLTIGDSIDVGTSHFVIDRVLTREGDAGSSFYGMGTRVMINTGDLAATELIIPGSRVEYRYLFAGDDTALDGYFDWLSPQLGKGARIITLHDNQPGIAGALDKAGIFLRLAGSLGVLLAALAAAFAAQRYCERHTDAVAVLKTLGAGKYQVLGLLAGQLVGLWLVATLIGFLLGTILEHAFLATMADWIPATLPGIGPYPFIVGAATGLICLATLVCPAFWHLLGVPPWRVLRSDSTGNPVYARSLWLALPGIGALLLLYSHDLKLVGLLLGGGMALILPVGILGWFFLRFGRTLSMQAGSLWRLGIANVLRRQWLSLLQVIVFGISFMLLAVMVLLRGSLLNEWKLQIPTDAPNVFLINIAPDEVENLRNSLGEINLQTSALYPMVRGRLTTINGKLATELFNENVGEVYRELNLSWSETLPPDNVITSGMWPGVTQDNTVPVPVSIEQGLAKRLHVQTGDLLEFTIGDNRLITKVTSIRSLNWDKMTPNFYFLFPTGALENYNATWMTSLYRDKQQEAGLSQLLRKYPTVSAYPVDDLLARIQTIVERASLAVEVILAIVLVAGILVLLACLRASIDQRLHESALLRTLGAGNKLILGSLAVEFIFIGLVAGILAASGAELTAWALQTYLFKMEYIAHPVLWVTVPILSTLTIGLTGTAFCYRTVIVPPMIILRESNNQG